MQVVGSIKLNGTISACRALLADFQQLRCLCSHATSSTVPMVFEPLLGTCKCKPCPEWCMRFFQTKNWMHLGRLNPPWRQNLSSPHLLVFEGQPIFEPHGQNLIGSARYYFLIRSPHPFVRLLLLAVFSFWAAAFRSLCVRCEVCLVTRGVRRAWCLLCLFSHPDRKSVV